jgi:hypothetical protein
MRVNCNSKSREHSSTLRVMRATEPPQGIHGNPKAATLRDANDRALHLRIRELTERLRELRAELDASTLARISAVRASSGVLPQGFRHGRPRFAW